MKKVLFLAALALSSVLSADDVIGGLVGAAIGGVIGNQFGGGDGKVAATIGGAAIGTMIGSGSNMRRYSDGGYTNPGYADGRYAPPQRYLSYTQPQPVYYVQPRQTIYVEQPPRVIYVRGRHHHDEYRADYGRGDGYRQMHRHHDDD